MMSHGFSVGRNNAEQRQRARSAQGAAQFAAGHAAARLATQGGGAARKLQITNYLTKIRVGKITTLKMVKQLSLNDLQVAHLALKTRQYVTAETLTPS